MRFDPRMKEGDVAVPRGHLPPHESVHHLKLVFVTNIEPDLKTRRRRDSWQLSWQMAEELKKCPCSAWRPCSPSKTWAEQNQLEQFHWFVSFWRSGSTTCLPHPGEVIHGLRDHRHMTWLSQMSNREILFWIQAVKTAAEMLLIRDLCWCPSGTHTQFRVRRITFYLWFGLEGAEIVIKRDCVQEHEWVSGSVYVRGNIHSTSKRGHFGKWGHLGWTSQLNRIA